MDEDAGMTFADASRVKQGWYLLDRSRRLRRHQVRALQVGPRRLVIAGTQLLRPRRAAA
jgi:hypothetical protein